MYDVAIVGGGLAGLNAALMRAASTAAGRQGLGTGLCGAAALWLARQPPDQGLELREAAFVDALDQGGLEVHVRERQPPAANPSASGAPAARTSRSRRRPSRG